MSVIPGKLAKEERENVRLGLDVNGSVYSYIQLCPRYKIDKDGDRIMTNVELYLKAFERANEYIHSAEHTSSVGEGDMTYCGISLYTYVESCLPCFNSCAFSCR